MIMMMAIRIRNAIALNIFHGTVDLVKEVAEATASAVAEATAEVVEAKKVAFAGGAVGVGIGAFAGKAVAVGVGAFAGGAVGVTVGVGVFAGKAVAVGVGTTLLVFLGTLPFLDVLFTGKPFVGSSFCRTLVLFRFGGISLSCIP